MTGTDTIVRHLEQLRIYLERLAELQRYSREVLKSDWHVQSMVERNLQLAIEAVVSIAEQVIASLSLPTPESSRDALSTLADAAVLTRALADALRQAVGFRTSSSTNIWTSIMIWSTRRYRATSAISKHFSS